MKVIAVRCLGKSLQYSRTILKPACTTICWADASEKSEQRHQRYVDKHPCVSIGIQDRGKWLCYSLRQNEPLLFAVQVIPPL